MCDKRFPKVRYLADVKFKPLKQEGQISRIFLGTMVSINFQSARKLKPICLAPMK